MTYKQQLFIKYYAPSGNATESAKKAGYSNRTAYSQGQRLLKHAEVSKLIHEERTKLAEELNLTREKLLNKLISLERTTTNDTVRARCIELEARITGNLTENKQFIVAQANVRPTVSDEELTEKVREEMKKEGKDEVNRVSSG